MYQQGSTAAFGSILEWSAGISMVYMWMQIELGSCDVGACRVPWPGCTVGVLQGHELCCFQKLPPMRRINATEK